MLSTDKIWKSIELQMAFLRGRFRLNKNLLAELPVTQKEIPSHSFLIPLIESIDSNWIFANDPTPYIAGALVEFLRGCKFYESGNPRDIVQIIQDKSVARNIGAFDTPAAIVRHITGEVLSFFDKTKPPPKILDPACGAGYFFIEAMDFLSGQYPEISIRNIAVHHIKGMDLDKVALALSKRNINWFLKQKNELELTDSDIKKILFHSDAISNMESLPFAANSFDCVIGNPPYQFLSGKGSPVEHLRRSGKLIEAEKLLNKIENYSRIFPLTSRGCRDLYKWFINRSIDLLKPDGVLGFITPNTWISYPRYKDLRELLATEGQIISVVDLGSHAFSRAHVPASIIIWRHTQSSVNKNFPCIKLDIPDVGLLADSNYSISAELTGNKSPFTINDDYEFEKVISINKSKPLLINSTPAPHRMRLGEIATLREGSHGIASVDIDIPHKPDETNTYPVLIDKTMGSLISPVNGYIASPDPIPVFIEHHQGERFLIRKTGDRIIAAPAPFNAFALAHQNVYVGKMKSPLISFYALLGILASDLLTKFYRQGRGGQRNRPYAQLRIIFLNQLPIIVPPAGLSIPAPSENDINALLKNLKDRKYYEIEPISAQFPSDKMNSEIVASNISLYLTALDKITRQLIASPDINLKSALDILVRKLYGVQD
jgi:SAM-dependent methyltransferase